MSGVDQFSPEVQQKAGSIARQTMSPFCPGRTLSDCPSPNAAEWRREIAQMVAEGRSAGEIQSLFEARSSRDLSGIPNRESSWALPGALTMAAALVLLLVLRRLLLARSSSLPRASAGTDASSRTLPAGSGAAAASLSSPVDGARLDDELARLDDD